MSFSYALILKESFLQVFKNKKLWFLGIFLTQSGLVMFFVSKVISLEETTPFFYRLFEAVEINFLAEMILKQRSLFLLWLIVLLSFIISSLVSLVFKASTLGFLKNLKENQQMTLWQEIKIGVQKIWVFLLYEVFVNVPNLFLLLILFVCQALTKDFWFILVFCFLILYNLFLMMFRHYSYCQLVFEGEDVWSATKNGFEIFIKNFKVTFWVNVLRVGIHLVYVLAFFVSLIIISMPFVLLIFLASLLGHWLLPFLMAILAVVSFVAVFLIYKGLKLSYVYTLLTRTYWKLTE